MMTRKQAERHAENMQSLHNEPWLVFRTPDTAPINGYPLNVYNGGRYAACKTSERPDYERGGATFL